MVGERAVSRAGRCLLQLRPSGRDGKADGHRSGRWILHGLSHRADLAAKGYLSREALFTTLGFSSVEALDISRFDGAEIEFDLNSAALPEALAGRFGAVFDHGTMEHVFHIPNCLANIHGMLKPGGRVVHTNPASNQIDQGFYMFSPTFFHDFYSANGWEIRTLQLVRFDPQRPETEEPTFLASSDNTDPNANARSYRAPVRRRT
jgi:SAM-dependent methyltransferase